MSTSGPEIKEFPVLMRRFVHILAKFADPDPKHDREALQGQLVEAWDDLTESIINAVLEMSPATLAQFYPAIVQTWAAAQVIQPHMVPVSDPS